MASLLPISRSSWRATWTPTPTQRRCASGRAPRRSPGCRSPTETPWACAHPGSAGPEAATYTRDNPWPRMDWPFRRIDHILVRLVRGGVPSLTIRGCERAFDEPVDDVHASDHFALIADLDPPP